MKGIFKFQLQDKEVGFKFGTYAMAIACDKDKCSLSVFLNRIGLVESSSPRKVKELSLMHLFYGAAVNYYEHINRDVDFTPSHVSDWLDEIGYEKITETFERALIQYVPKNSQAPETAGQQTN